MLSQETLSLLPFVRRARIAIVGRETILKTRFRLQFIIVADELSDKSRQEVLKEFAPYPIVGGFTEAEIAEHLGFQGTKLIGMAKSDLAKSLYATLKANRLNPPRTGI